MANAFEIAFGWVPAEAPCIGEQAEDVRKKRPKARSQVAIEWMRQTGSSQRRTARQFSISQAAISQQLKSNRETCFCPACHRKMPIKQHQP